MKRTGIRKTPFKRKKVKKRRKVSDRTKLIKKGDDLHRALIRKRDFDENGECPCITCGDILYFGDWRRAQVGHFMVRSYMATRWHLKNANIQCAKCNMFRGGEQFLHGKAIDKKFGKGWSDKLIKLAQSSGKFTLIDIQEMINELLRIKK